MEPILIDFPEEFETENLIIRAPKADDVKAVNEAIKASINELKPWLPFAQQEQSMEDTEINIRTAVVKFLEREDLRLHVFLKKTGQFIMSSGLHRIDWDVRKFEIGYWADSRYTGKGYVTEAVKGITDFAFRELDANRIEIRCDTLNEKSAAVAIRLSYELEGILKKDHFSTDRTELRDTYVFAKVREA
ncbi:GNAT family N-acetyltransferase [Oceanobacillus massiliensis]|uniref:GNAT family N-acetyltransferase n=1 Tax=Oceanobacillus massiliensis TaxID=1465765 RepID=UPI000288FE8F|nr:GNAT family protein [Oceanobacillus massiliensis]